MGTPEIAKLAPVPESHVGRHIVKEGVILLRCSRNEYSEDGVRRSNILLGGGPDVRSSLPLIILRW